MKKVLIADFFGSIKARGIPAYVKDLELLAAEVAVVRVLRAPVAMRRLPTTLQNLLMVAHEQLVVPLVALFWRPHLIVFPYNSASLLCSLSSRSVCVIHDLIPYRRRYRRWSPAFLYLLATTSWHAAWRRRVAGVSPYTMRLLRQVRRFQRCPICYLPNCFLTMKAQLGSGQVTRRITLVSGHSRNKDFAGALRLYDAFVRHAADPDPVGLDVVGFGDQSTLAVQTVAALAQQGMHLRGVQIHALLPRAELDSMLRTNAVTWAHSTAEGFGRVVVEGRMAGRPVVMSRLAVFRPFQDDATFAYSNSSAGSFCDALMRALRQPAQRTAYTVVANLQEQARTALHTLLEAPA
jgi:glycosyltransferase involved in cell wall biosynthesis